jgi:hypothetical protein
MGLFHVARGRVYARARRWTHAARAFEAALRRDDSDARWHAGLARVRFEARQWQAAADAITAALERDDRNPRWHVQLALALEGLQRWEAAAGAYDGFIVGWYQKRHLAFWRPVTAIRKADTDGNPRTEPDPTWLALRPTPQTPDYPSTHSLLGSAAAEILRRLTGTNAFSFCMASTTSTPPGSERCWRSFTQAELENAESRVLVGFHFRFAIETGVSVGRKVGRHATRHALRPLRRH